MKHKFIAKRYWKDQSTAMGQSDVLAKSFDDVINLSLGDPDLITHERIIDKAFADAKAGHTKYTEFRGDPELRQEISKFYKEEYNMDVADEEIFVCTSACEGMYLVMESILDDGDEVIVQAPYFTPYPQQIELARGIPVELPTYEEEDFQIDVDRLESGPRPCSSTRPATPPATACLWRPCRRSLPSPRSMTSSWWPMTSTRRLAIRAPSCPSPPCLA